MGGRTWLCGTSLLLLSCSAELGGPNGEPGEVGLTVAALGVCDEDVPAERYVDGIPAFAQCAGSENTAIYSNDGVNTAATQMGPDWVRTQWSGGYQCTELAHRYLLFKWNIDWLPRGNAGEWCDSIPPDDSGVEQTDTPVHGDLMVLAPGSCGAAASTGHVTVVDVVEADGRLTVVEQNRARRGRYEQSCAACFIHVIANPGDGSGGAGVGGDAGDGGAGTAAAGVGSAGTAGVSGAAGVGGAAGLGGAAGVSAGAAGIAGIAGVAGAAGVGGAAGASAPVAGSAAAAGAAGIGAAGATAAGAAGTAPVAGMQSMPSATSGTGTLGLPMMERTREPVEAESCAASHGRRVAPAPFLVLTSLIALLLARRRVWQRARRSPAQA